jgi:hypothetical protein
MKLTDQDEKDLKEFAEIRANMKAFLKQQSKNELIKMIFEQLDLYIQLRREFKALQEPKGDLNEESSTNNTTAE